MFFWGLYRHVELLIVYCPKSCIHPLPQSSLLTTWHFGYLGGQFIQFEQGVIDFIAPLNEEEWVLALIEPQKDISNATDMSTLTYSLIEAHLTEPTIHAILRLWAPQVNKHVCFATKSINFYWIDDKTDVLINTQTQSL